MPKSVDECYRNLACAIIHQACQDYLTALRKDNKKEEAEIRHFFLSSWFDKLNCLNFDGEYLMKLLKKRAKEGEFYCSQKPRCTY